MAATNALLAFGVMTFRWREDIRAEPQLCEEADMTANRGDQIERRETGVGDDYDLAIWHRFNAAVSFRQMMGEAPLQANPLPEKKPGEAFGPFKPFSQARDAGLDARQRRFVARSDRTLHNAHARFQGHDPGITSGARRSPGRRRIPSGMEPEWKEIVYPFVTVRSEGSKFWDVDDNIYIDLLNGFGPTASASVSVRHS